MSRMMRIELLAKHYIGDRVYDPSIEEQNGQRPQAFLDVPEDYPISELMRPACDISREKFARARIQSTGILDPVAKLPITGPGADPTGISKFEGDGPGAGSGAPIDLTPFIAQLEGLRMSVDRLGDIIRDATSDLRDARVAAELAEELEPEPEAGQPAEEGAAGKGKGNKH